MIKGIGIENFKIFNERHEFGPISAFNILTGINGRGKSSLLQAFVAISQSMRQNGNFLQLCLNGEQVRLGTALDVKNEENRRENYTRFGFAEDDRHVELSFSFPGDKAPYLTLEEISVNGKILDVPAQDFSLIPALKSLSDITFISAERIGPRLSYEGSNDVAYVGSRGEYAPCALYNHKDEVVADDMVEALPDFFPELIVEDLDKSFRGVLQLWLSAMFRPTSVDADYIAETNAYTLRFSNLSKAGKFKSTNVGFGYTYVLPVLVAGMLAKKDSVFIIENPEAHLHPLAQSVLGKFLAWLTLRGVQIFVETHSEHILNSPRVLIAQDVMAEDKLSILYFDERIEKGHKYIPVGTSGRIREWPDGFFDQMEKDNDIIIGL